MNYILQVSEAEPERLRALLEERLGEEGTDAYMKTGAERLIEQGLERGRAEGRAEVLIRQLARRFATLDPTVATRVRAGSIAELDRWADRVLTAATLAEVFADD